MRLGYTFNLVDKPWIPCVSKDGSIVELSLYDTLANAHNIQEITDESPLVTAALHRVLLAIMHRVLGPKNEAEWRSIWNDGDPNIREDELLRYLDDWRHRFDLFDKKWPFYQVASFAVGNPSPVARLRQELASGNNPTLFDHSYESNEMAMTAAEAARSVIATQSFALGGGRSATIYTRDAPIARSAVILMRGDSLAQTLVLNLVRYDHDAEVNEPFAATGEDMPAWEQDSAPVPGPRVPNGYVDLLTWQSRMLRLEPEGSEDEPLVRRVHFAQAEVLESLPENAFVDPQAVGIRDEKLGMTPLRFDSQRAVWRDSVALLRVTPMEAGDVCRPNKALEWLGRMAVSGHVQFQATYRLSVLGLETEPGRAKARLWRREDMPLPTVYLSKPMLMDYLGEALTIAEEAGEAVRSATWRLAKLILYPLSEDPDVKQKWERKPVTALAGSLNRLTYYWGALDVEFAVLLGRVVDDPDDALLRWSRACERAAREAFDRTIASLEQNARSLRATTRVSGALAWRISRIAGGEAG